MSRNQQSEYRATVVWERNDQDFLANHYSRVHEWHFDGTVVQATASPHIVPAPWSDGTFVDPEQAFVASLSSCHMLFFLALAANKGVLIDRYEDHATGVLEDRCDGKLAMTLVTLNPKLVIAGSTVPDPDLIGEIHHKAHEKCFIANSVRTQIVINHQQ